MTKIAVGGWFYCVAVGPAMSVPAGSAVSAVTPRVRLTGFLQTAAVPPDYPRLLFLPGAAAPGRRVEGRGREANPGRPGRTSGLFPRPKPTAPAGRRLR